MRSLFCAIGLFVCSCSVLRPNYFSFVIILESQKAKFSHDVFFQEHLYYLCFLNLLYKYSNMKFFKLHSHTHVHTHMHTLRVLLELYYRQMNWGRIDVILYHSQTQQLSIYLDFLPSLLLRFVIFSTIKVLHTVYQIHFQVFSILSVIINGTFYQYFIKVQLNTFLR